jgi:hypothetical protein
MSGGLKDAGTGMHRDAAPVVLTGCAAQVPTSIFGASCELNTCHNSMPAPAGMAYLLDLQSPGVASRLVDVTAIEEPSLKLIDPINPANSWILAKVKDTPPPVGLQMPEMGAKLTAAQIACLEQWVDAEAAGPY